MSIKQVSFGKIYWQRKRLCSRSCSGWIQRWMEWGSATFQSSAPKERRARQPRQPMEVAAALSDAGKKSLSSRNSPVKNTTGPSLRWWPQHNEGEKRQKYSNCHETTTTRVCGPCSPNQWHRALTTLILSTSITASWLLACKNEVQRALVKHQLSSFKAWASSVKSWH